MRAAEGFGEWCNGALKVRANKMVALRAVESNVKACSLLSTAPTLQNGGMFALAGLPKRGRGRAPRSRYHLHEGRPKDY